MEKKTAPKKSIPTDQVKITRYLLRSKIPLKTQENENSAVTKKKPLSNSLNLKKRTVNPSYNSRDRKQKEKVTKIKQKPQECDDPYNFDSFIEEYEKENAPEAKSTKRKTKKTGSGTKASRAAIRKKKIPTASAKLTKHPVSSPGKRTAVSPEPQTHSDQVVNRTSPSGDESRGIEELRRRNSKLSLEPTQELSLNLHASFDKDAEKLDCYTSTPHNAENDPVGLSKVGSLWPQTPDDLKYIETLSPICSDLLNGFAKTDLDSSGFKPAENTKTYRPRFKCRSTIKRSVSQKGDPGIPNLVVKGIGNSKKRKRIKPTKFDNWASIVNESLREAEQFELVVE